MATDVIMPKVDMDQETGTVIRWLKQNGDMVKQGETILEIETDKVAIDVEAPASGILTNILVREGETVPIATIIATILEPGETLPEATPLESREIPAKGPTPPSTMDMTPTDNGVLATPVARKLAVKSGVDLTTVLGSGPQGKITKKDVQAATAVDSAGPPDKVYATPAARRVALEGNVALERVTGSGPDGRIQAADVVAAAARTAAVTPLVARRDAAPEVTIIPLRGKRKVISERMTASYQSIPHINFTARVDMARFNETRAELNAHADTSGSTRVSATALMVKCVAQTLLRHPWLNSSFQEDEIYLYRDVNIGVAVALEDGLIVPVVHNAAQKNVAQIAVEVADLASRAKDGQLTPADVHGGTFTLSNLGPFGVEQFTAIINPPQAAVLAAGVIQPEVVPDAQEQVAVRPMMHMTLSVDHRVVDGAVAAHFIADLKSVLVLPLLLL